MKTVLIVEDEAVNAIFMKNFFLKSGFEVFDPVKTGEEAIRMADENTVDLIIMDIQLIGEIDGITAMQKILEYKTIPHIYCSAYNQKDIIERANTTSPIAYLTKPVDVTLLKALVKGYF